MTVQEFIEKAVEGGWYNFAINAREYPNGVAVGYNHGLELYRLRKDGSEGRRSYIGDVSHILLDPAAWKAVGKVEGWDGPDTPKPFGNSTSHAKGKMTALIPHLWSGRTIESYLASL